MKRMLSAILWGLVIIGICGIAHAIPQTGDMNQAIETMTSKDQEPKASTKTKKEKEEAAKKQRKGAKHHPSSKKGKQGSSSSTASPSGSQAPSESH